MLIQPSRVKRAVGKACLTVNILPNINLNEIVKKLILFLLAGLFAFSSLLAEAQTVKPGTTVKTEVVVVRKHHRHRHHHRRHRHRRVRVRLLRRIRVRRHHKVASNLPVETKRVAKPS
jgi:hypothetical protein